MLAGSIRSFAMILQQERPAAAGIEEDALLSPGDVGGKPPGGLEPLGIRAIVVNDGDRQFIQWTTLG